MTQVSLINRVYSYIYRELDIFTEAISSMNKAGLERKYRALEESFINSAISEYEWFTNVRF